MTIVAEAFVLFVAAGAIAALLFGRLAGDPFVEARRELSLDEQLLELARDREARWRSNR